MRFPPEKTCHPTLTAGRSSPKSKLVSRFRCFAQEHVGKTGFPCVSCRVTVSVFLHPSTRGSPPETPAERLSRTGMTEHTVKSLRFGAAGVVPAWSSGQPDLPTLKTLLITGSCCQVSLFGLFTFWFNSQVVASSRSAVLWVSRFRL